MMRLTHTEASLAAFILIPLFLLRHCKKIHHRGTEITEKTQRRNGFYIPPCFFPCETLHLLRLCDYFHFLFYNAFT